MKAPIVLLSSGRIARRAAAVNICPKIESSVSDLKELINESGELIPTIKGGQLRFETEAERIARQIFKSKFKNKILDKFV